MKNISFDNPYLLFLFIPLALVITVPFFLVRNKDNRSVGWTASLFIHLIISALITLAAAGLSQSKILTKTTVYVLADVSYSSERNMDEIDGYIEKIRNSLPENSKLGLVCFGKDCEILTSPGRTLRSVSEASVDITSTDIAGALNFTAGLFDGDTENRIILITDGNDTSGKNVSSIASAVENITENGIKIDAVFLDNSLSENDKEVQLFEAEFSSNTYLGHKNEARFLIKSSSKTDTSVSLYVRELDEDGVPISDFELLSDSVITADSGVSTVRMTLLSDKAGTYEYKVALEGGEDISEHNNTRTFTQRIVGNVNILLVTGSYADEELVRNVYGQSADIDTFVVGRQNDRVPVNIEEIIKYDEIILSNFNIKDVRNSNAFVDVISDAVSQYGKSLITLGNLELHTNSDDPTFKKLEELLPVDFGSTGVDGRLYTIVLDASHSMFMAEKFTIAKDTAVKLLSVIEDNDYVCLVTFSGKVNVKIPRRAGDVKEELIAYIDGLKTTHGTDIGLGLEEALSAVNALNLSHNQIMVISDGLSFDSERSALEVAADLYAKGAAVSAVNVYVPSTDMNGTGIEILKNIVNAGEGGKFYQLSKVENVSNVVFGSVAENFSDVIINKNSSVNVAKPMDEIISGISSLPKVSGYILSVAKYDATVPLTLTYLKNNGYQETVPFYAYRSHGNGRVASLATSLTGGWIGLWSEDEKAAFLSNLLLTNTPDERIDLPFIVNVDRTEYKADIELVPANLDPSAAASLIITYPGGRRITRSLTFDGSKYFFSFDTNSAGTYALDVTYTSGENSYTYETEMEVAYLPEYDMFVSFDKYNVYQFMRDNGETCVGEIPDLELDENEVLLYKQSYIIPLLIVASVLFVADIVVRKLRINKKPKMNKINREEKRV